MAEVGGHVVLYALLVGIDGYREPVRRLAGCGNDVSAAAALLESRLAAAEYAPLCLRDGDATRAAVIDGFRRHLGRAGPEDSALFWFSGHGSQAPVPPEWAHLEPTGLLQTILCVDSRHDGVPDLYDKELALLIGEITARGVHVVAVMDCCHADSATRQATAVRAATGPPKLPSFVARWEPAATSPTPTAALLDGLADRPAVPRIAHVSLAACHSHQFACETSTPEGGRGLFSLALLEQLGALGFAATYRELMAGARCRVENVARAQIPVLSPSADALVDRPFLGGRITVPRSAVTMRCLRDVWEVDAGACHGMAAGTARDPSLLAVHGSDPPLEVRVVTVLADRSLVEPIGWAPAPARQYPMILTSVPLPVGTVALGGAPGDDEKTLALIATALGVAAPGGLPSPHVRALDPSGPLDAARSPDTRVSTPGPGVARITDTDGTPLVPEAPCRTSGEASRVVTDLEHIARWRRIKGLDNPLSALPNAVVIEVVAVRAGEVTDPGNRPALRPGRDGAVHLDYRRGSAGWAGPEVFVRLRNTTGRQLYCVLLDLTDRFRVHAELFSGDWVAPHHTASAAWGQVIDLALPPGRPVVPGATGTDWFKVLVAETPFNAAAFALGRVGEPEGACARRGSRGYRGVLDRLGLAALDRDMGAARPAAGDWTTAILPIVVHVPEV